MRTARTIVALLGAALLSACSDNSNPFGTDSGRGDGSVDGTNILTDGQTINRDIPMITPDSMDPMLNPDAACRTTMTPTQRAPMNLLIVLDRSGSMSENGKWDAAVRGVNRLLTLLDDSARVGLTMFPALSSPGSESGYAMPRVPIAPLSTSRPQIMSALGAGPTGNTPMACAMIGTRNNADSIFTGDGTRNVVLITDGVPTDECSGFPCTNPFDFNCLLMASMYSQRRIQATTQELAMLSPTVRTFVVGTDDASPSFLTSIAVNGRTERSPGCGTSSTCHYSLGSATFEADLNAALDSIRGRAATCEFRIMIDPTTEDPNLVNVNYTPSGGSSRVVPRDRSRMNGWDYAPDMRSIIFYGPVCDQVLNDNNGNVQILFGCPTVTPG